MNGKTPISIKSIGLLMLGSRSFRITFLSALAGVVLFVLVILFIEQEIGVIRSVLTMTMVLCVPLIARTILVLRSYLLQVPEGEAATSKGLDEFLKRKWSKGDEKNKRRLPPKDVALYLLIGLFCTVLATKIMSP